MSLSQLGEVQRTGQNVPVNRRLDTHEFSVQQHVYNFYDFLLKLNESTKPLEIPKFAFDEQTHILSIRGRKGDWIKFPMATSCRNGVSQ